MQTSTTPRYSNYLKVGRMQMSISKVVKIKAADILIDISHLKHIAIKHKSELAKLGLTAQNFVKIIISSFTRIYKDEKTGAYYLAVYDEKTTNAAVIELNYVENLQFWEIKTAAPFRTAFFKNKLLVWKRERTP